MPSTSMRDGTSLHPDPAASDELPDGPPAELPPLLTAVGAAGFMAPLREAGFLGTKDEIQSELDAIAAAVRRFHIQQPDQVMKQCAAYGARLTELTVLLHRVEALDRQYTRVRTQQVEKWLAELDRQFKIASRLVEVARQDLSLLGGM